MITTNDIMLYINNHRDEFSYFNKAKELLNMNTKLKIIEYVYLVIEFQFDEKANFDDEKFCIIFHNIVEYTSLIYLLSYKLVEAAKHNHNLFHVYSIQKEIDNTNKFVHCSLEPDEADEKFGCIYVNAATINNDQSVNVGKVYLRPMDLDARWWKSCRDKELLNDLEKLPANVESYLTGLDTVKYQHDIIYPLSNTFGKKINLLIAQWLFARPDYVMVDGKLRTKNIL